METTLTKEVAVETKSEELLKEISDIDLMLVGGGLAAVSFC